MDTLPVIILKRGKDESLRRFHPWVFSGAIARMDDNIEEGNLVRVLSHEGETIGVGHYQIGSIAVRMLEFGCDTLPEDFFTTRLAEGTGCASRSASCVPTMTACGSCTARVISCPGS